MQQPQLRIGCKDKRIQLARLDRDTLVKAALYKAWEPAGDELLDEEMDINYTHIIYFVENKHENGCALQPS